jgi:phosphonopyruvate decarboxylase
MPVIPAEEFNAELRNRGVSLVSGVPCGWLQGPLALMADEPGYYIAAANEGSALSIAAGAALGGSRSAVMIQNSGFGNLLNPLTSLIGTFEIPVLVVMTLRGWPDPTADEPQHALAGRTAQCVLDELGIDHRVLAADPSNLAAAMDDADNAHNQGRPYFLLVPRGVIGRVERPASASGLPAFDRGQAVESLLPWLADAAVFTTTGRTSRDTPRHWASALPWLAPGVA